MNVRQPKIIKSASRLQERDELIKQTKRGDDRACCALDAELRGDAQLGRGSLDLAARSDQAIFGRLTDWDNTRRQTLTRQIEAMKVNLAGPSPTVQEQWLASLIAKNWLLCCEADQAYAEAARCNWSNSVEALENMKAAHHRLIESTKDLAAARAARFA